VVLGLLTLAVYLYRPEQVVGDPIEIVSPSAYAGTEADGYVATRPDGRWQTVFPASDFSSLPDGYTTITQMTYRPDAALSQPLTTTYGHLLIRLSTTSVSSPNLDWTFADNIGEDETEVFNGPLTVSTANEGPPEGPKAFDQVVEFERPFEYDPDIGNLLVDFAYTNLSPHSVDFVSNPSALIHTVKGNDPSGSEAVDDYGGVVFQFTFMPDVTADFDADGDIDIEDYHVWQAGFGITESAGRGDGNTDGDDDVDGKDFLTWQRQYGFGTSSLGRLAVPEPASIGLLLSITAPVFTFRRRRWSA